MNREEYIKDGLKAHYDEACSLGHEIFAITVQGSQNYNLDIYSSDYKSDIDTKAIILPSFQDFCAGRSPLSTTHVRSNNEHIDLKDIRVIFETFKKQNINFVEILFSKYYIVPEKYMAFWKRLQGLAESLTHCHPAQTVRTMTGMSCEKRKALCHPYPTTKDKIEKYGYDGKQLHHIIRLNEFIKNYISGKSFAECLKLHDKETLNLMVNAKLNQFTLAEAVEMADKFNNETLQIKDKFIEENGNDCNSEPYVELENIKAEVLLQWFTETIKKHNENIHNI